MSSEKNQIIKTLSSPYTTTSAIASMILGLINWLVPNVDEANKLAFLAVPLGAISSYLISLVMARYLITPEEIAKKQKLKRDREEILKLIKEAEENSNLYTPEQLQEYKNELHETNRLLINIGKDNIPNKPVRKSSRKAL